MFYIRLDCVSWLHALYLCQLLSDRLQFNCISYKCILHLFLLFNATKQDQWTKLLKRKVYINTLLQYDIIYIVICMKWLHFIVVYTPTYVCWLYHETQPSSYRITAHVEDKIRHKITITFKCLKLLFDTNVSNNHILKRPLHQTKQNNSNANGFAVYLKCNRDM